MAENQIITLLKDLLPFLIPIYLVQIGMVIYSLVDLKRRTLTHGPRWLWAVILTLFALTLPSGIIAAAIYLAWGRNVEEPYDTN